MTFPFSTDVFKADDDYLENEEKYKELKKGKFFVVVCVCEWVHALWCSHDFTVIVVNNCERWQYEFAGQNCEEGSHWSWSFCIIISLGQITDALSATAKALNVGIITDGVLVRSVASIEVSCVPAYFGDRDPVLRSWESEKVITGWML